MNLSKHQTKMPKKKKDPVITRTKEAFKKMKKIEIELADGNMEYIDYFVKWSGIQGLNYALEWASYYGHLELVKQVIKAGANPNASNGIALQMACRNGHTDVVKYLIELGMLNNIPDLNILLEVVENRHIEIAKYLLSNENIFGTNLCDIHADHDCALRLAVEMDYIEMIKLLLEYGANPNIFDGYLIESMTNKGNMNMVKLLTNN